MYVIRVGPCQHGSIRLVNGLAYTQGVVEICDNGRWGALCANSWDNTDATVVCREEGYSPYGIPYIYDTDL